MRRFEVTVIRTDVVTIEIDETIVTEQYIEDFESAFWPVGDVQGVAESLAKNFVYKDARRFLEGFGNVTQNGKLPFSRADYDKEGKLLPEDQRDMPAPEFNIVTGFDTNYEIYSDEL